MVEYQKFSIGRCEGQVNLEKIGCGFHVFPSLKTGSPYSMNSYELTTFDY